VLAERSSDARDKVARIRNQINAVHCWDGNKWEASKQEYSRRRLDLPETVGTIPECRIENARQKEDTRRPGDCIVDWSLSKYNLLEERGHDGGDEGAPRLLLCCKSCVSVVMREAYAIEFFVLWLSHVPMRLGSLM
jgi:hypothetical protein